MKKIKRAFVKFLYVALTGHRPSRQYSLPKALPWAILVLPLQGIASGNRLKACDNIARGIALGENDIINKRPVRAI